jgi:hypothetical protein
MRFRRAGGTRAGVRGTTISGAATAVGPAAFSAAAKVGGRKERSRRARRARRAGGDVLVLGADDAVDEADGELQAVGVGEHAGVEAGAA